MRVHYGPRAVHALEKAPPAVRKALYKQVAFLLQGLRHPSLRAKKYDEARDVRQARVNDDWRFYFTITGDVYRVEEVRKHPK